MILFAEDWKKYPNAHLHVETNNKSFIRIAQLYKAMGVRNHAFPLQLLDKRLIGVDPHSPNLTEDQMAMVMFESRRNIFYWLREVARPPGGTAGDPLQFLANRGSIGLIWMFLNHIDSVLIQPRQTGKSFSSDMLMTWLLNLRCYHTHINLLTMSEALRSTNLLRLRSIEAEMPWYMRMRKPSDVANTEAIHVSRLKNTYKAHLPQSSEKMANLVARGSTAAITQIDEAAFFKYVHISAPAALAAGGNVRDRAAQRNDPYGTLFTTTAGKLDEPEGAWVFRLLSEAAIFTEKFFDCKNIEELHQSVRQHARMPDDEEGGVRNNYASPTVDMSFNHRQLGYTDDWLRRKIAEARATGDEARRDFLGHWTHGLQSSPLTPEILERIANSKRDDFLAKTERNGFIVRWYLTEDQMTNLLPKLKCVVGLDPSEACNRDDIGMVIREVTTGAVIGVGVFNGLNINDFSNWFADFLVEHKNFTAVIERKSSGPGIIDNLLEILPLHNEDPFARLFNTIVHRLDTMPAMKQELARPLRSRDRMIYVNNKSCFGFATSGVGEFARSGLYGNTLQSAAHYTSTQVHDRQLINQINSLEMKNGRIDHREGCHDDLVIAWLLSYWLITNGRNLQFYGIQASAVMSNNGVSRKETDPVAMEEHRKAQAVRVEIDKLLELMRRENDEMITRSYEGKLRRLIDENPKINVGTLSVDDLVEKVRKERRERRILKKAA